jgi:hypothetical protein
MSRYENPGNWYGRADKMPHAVYGGLVWVAFPDYGKKGRFEIIPWCGHQRQFDIDDREINRVFVEKNGGKIRRRWWYPS